MFLSFRCIRLYKICLYLLLNTLFKVVPCFSSNLLLTLLLFNWEMLCSTWVNGMHNTCEYLLLFCMSSEKIKKGQSSPVIFFPSLFHYFCCTVIKKKTFSIENRITGMVPTISINYFNNITLILSTCFKLSSKHDLDNHHENNHLTVLLGSCFWTHEITGKNHFGKRKIQTVCACWKFMCKVKRIILN